MTTWSTPLSVQYRYRACRKFTLPLGELPKFFQKLIGPLQRLLRGVDGGGPGGIHREIHTQGNSMTLDQVPGNHGVMELALAVVRGAINESEAM
jgi:hypothetical protein